MILSDTHINSLLSQKSISEEWPWSSNNETVIDKNIKDIVAEIRRKIGLKDKTDYDHYGSGYASFVDCWLYREDDEFRFANGDNYWGLVILFSRLSKYYVIGEGQKTWKSKSSSSYLPCYEFVDEIKNPSIRGIVNKVCGVLRSRGLERLYKNQLSKILSKKIIVPTILSDGPWHHFDALFYWED